MSVKYSIIIPTAFAKLESILKRCLHSVKEQTDLTETEVIVVSNGATDDTDQYVQSLGEPFRLLSFPNAIGYSAAINAGIKASRGEFVILLNNDTEIYPPKNVWIQLLAAPFNDPQVAITGPWKNYCPHAERDFLIFFVVMIRKSVFDIIGLLDVEAFGMGYGEDCDLCCKAEDAGFKVVQVPEEKKLDYDGKQATGNFPIYHEGNATFKNWPGGEQLLAHNREILSKRYTKSKMKIDITKALNCDGFMSPEELAWLAEYVQNRKIVIEVGSWHGRSTRAIADHIPQGAILFAVDTWLGSIAEQETNHISAKLLDSDHAYDEFCRNLWDHIQCGRVIPLRMHSKHAAKLLLDKDVKAQLIFIDGGHLFKEVQEDCRNFCPLLDKGGIICGHDYMQGLAPEVTPAVDDIFGATNIGVGEGTTIWYTDYNPSKSKIEIKEKPLIFDCFPIYNELSILEIRLEELNDIVDRWIIVESSQSHQGNAKPFYLKENLYKFQKFAHKITHITMNFENLPIGDEVWGRERQQRDAILRGVPVNLPDDSLFIISDVDEIAKADVIKNLKINEILSLEMKNCYYYLNIMRKDVWREARIIPYKLLKNMTPCQVRYTQADKIPNAGWHFSYQGGYKNIINKIQNFAHWEYNQKEFLNEKLIKQRIQNGEDIYGRVGDKYEPYSINELPEYVVNNLGMYEALGMIYE